MKLALAVKTISEKEKKVAEAIEFATQMHLPAGNPATHIAAVVSVVAAVTDLLANAKGKVKGLTLLPEELAKELYCIALSEDPKMAKTLEDMDVRNESLALPDLQVRLRDAELNAQRRTTPTAVGLYGRAAANALMARAPPPPQAPLPAHAPLQAQADVLPPPYAFAAHPPPGTCKPCPVYTDDDAEARQRKQRFPQGCWFHTTSTHTWQQCHCLDTNGRPTPAACQQTRRGACVGQTTPT